MRRRLLTPLACLILATSMGHVALAEPTFMPKVDLPGNDYKSFELQRPRPRLCQESCLQDDRCQAWTFVRTGFLGPLASCWLKTKAEPPQTSDCCVSGTK